METALSMEEVNNTFKPYDVAIATKSYYGNKIIRLKYFPTAQPTSWISTQVIVHQTNQTLTLRVIYSQGMFITNGLRISALHA